MAKKKSTSKAKPKPKPKSTTKVTPEKQQTKHDIDSIAIDQYGRKLMNQFKSDPLVQKIDECIDCKEHIANCVINMVNEFEDIILDQMNNHCLHPEFKHKPVKKIEDKINQCIGHCSMARVCFLALTNRINESTVNQWLRTNCKVTTHGL